MRYYTQWDRPQRKPENFSNKMMPVYAKRTNKETGKKELYIKKEIDITKKIKEYSDEVSITKMIEKYQLNPIESLKKQETKIVDLTNVPQNLMEMQNEINKANEIWDGLSKKTKQRFDNDINVFLASSENGKLAQMLHDEIKTQASRFTQTQVVTQPTQNVMPGQVSVEQYQQMAQQQTPNNNGGNL